MPQPFHITPCPLTCAQTVNIGDNVWAGTQFIKTKGRSADQRAPAWEPGRARQIEATLDGLSIQVEFEAYANWPRLKQYYTGAEMLPSIMKGGAGSEEIYTQTNWSYWGSAEAQLGFVGINLLDPVAGGAVGLTADAERITVIGGTLVEKDINDRLFIQAHTNYNPLLHTRPSDFGVAFEDEETLYTGEAPCAHHAPQLVACLLALALALHSPVC